MVGAGALRAAPERLGKEDTSFGGICSPVFSTLSSAPLRSALVVTHTDPRSGRLWTIALCTRFVVICSSSAREPTVGAMSAELSIVTPRLSASGKRVSVASSAARDRSTGSRLRVDGVEAVDELAGPVTRIGARHVEKGLRDGQWGAQLVGRVGGEPLLLGDVLFQPRQHGVEGVGELAELVSAAG